MVPWRELFKQKELSDHKGLPLHRMFDLNPSNLVIRLFGLSLDIVMVVA